MKKAMLLFAVLLVAFGPVFAAEAGEQNKTCKYTPAKQLLEAWNATEVGGVPDCPADPSDCTTNGNFCISGSFCQITGAFDSVDTGLTKCRTSEGLVNCQGGQTVYITTSPCEWCPCCYVDCICGSCQQFVRVSCGPYAGPETE